MLTFIALPRRPGLGNEMEELVYARLLGRQHVLVVVAALVTVATVFALVVTLPQRVDPSLSEARRVSQYFAATAAGQPLCYHLEADGRWLEVARQADGQWVIVRTLPALPAAPADRGVSQG